MSPALIELLRLHFIAGGQCSEHRDWQRLSAGSGDKGPRPHDWCYLELADLEAEEFSDENHGLWTRGLFIRRNIADGDLAYFITWCPAGRSITTLVSVEGHRWAIEDSFETTKNEFGLDHNETRAWHGWHRHASLVMLAFCGAVHIRLPHRNPTSNKNYNCNASRAPGKFRAAGPRRKSMTAKLLSACR